MNETVLEAINLYLVQSGMSPVQDFNQAIVVTSNVYLGNL